MEEFGINLEFNDFILILKPLKLHEAKPAGIVDFLEPDLDRLKRKKNSFKAAETWRLGNRKPFARRNNLREKILKVRKILKFKII